MPHIIAIVTFLSGAAQSVADAVGRPEQDAEQSRVAVPRSTGTRAPSREGRRETGAKRPGRVNTSRSSSVAYPEARLITDPLRIRKSSSVSMCSDLILN